MLCRELRPVARWSLLALVWLASAMASPAEAAYAPGCTVPLSVPLAIEHEFRDVVIQPDGKFLAAGYVDDNDGSGRDFLLARFHPDLTLDVSFNAPLGYVIEDFYGMNDEAYTIAIQTDRRIVVAGYADDPAGRYMGFARYEKDGTLEPSWATFVIDFVGNQEEVRDMLFQPDGQLVAVGYYTPVSVKRIAAVRLTRGAGNIDFGFDGTPAIAGSTQSMATGIFMEPSGRLVVSADATFSGTGQDFTVLRFRQNDGTLDGTFGASGGFTNVDMGSSLDTTAAIARLPTGAFVVAGSANANFAVAGFTPSGLLDVGAFGTGGRAFRDFGSNDAAHDVAIDSGANIVVAGEARVASLDFASARFTPAGLLAFSFTNDVTGMLDRVNGVQVTRSGQLLFAGATAGPINPVATIALFNPDGTQTCAPAVNPVQVFTAAATGDSLDGQVMLNWLNPSSGLYDETVLKRVPGCPATTADGVVIAARSDGLGNTGGYTDTVPLGSPSYYAAFVEDAANNPSAVACVEATPFDRDLVGTSTEWTYHTGISVLSTPGVKVDFGGGESVAYAVSNDGVLHAISGGPVELGGGSWPSTFRPPRLGDAAPSRPLIMPLPPTNQLAVITGSEDGRVYAIDATSGEMLWRSPYLGARIVASPAAVLTTFGGLEDYVFVGTRDSIGPSRFYALHATDGNVAWAFDNGGANDVGMIVSSATVDYTNHRVFFTSHVGGSGNAIWCLRYSGSSPTPCAGWGSFGVPTLSLGDVSTSPIRYKSWIYISDDSTGELLLVDPATGSSNVAFLLFGSGANGYVFPRFFQDVVFVTDPDRIWALDTSTPSAFSIWDDPLPDTPSTPLHVPGTEEVYVGTADGKLIRFGASFGGATTRCLGTCTGGVGSPSYDLFRRMIYIGTAQGEIHGVRTPF